MKRSLEDYEYYNNVFLNCHKKCKRLVHADPFILNDREIEEKSISELRLFEKLIKKSLCLSRCLDERLGERPTHDPSKLATVDSEFRRFMPYSYMQICYWKLGELEQAVKAAYTYVIKNPNDSMMVSNLNFYQNQPGFSTQMLKNLQESEHEAFYLKGQDYYDDEDYGNAIINFEWSLDSYLKSFENCIALCVKIRPNKWNDNYAADIYSAFTGHLRNTLLCRMECIKQLNTIRSVTLHDFIPIIFNYLQFAYYKTHKLKKACESVSTYLLFSPNDQTMLDNRKFYQNQAQVTEDLFVPRDNFRAYVERYVLNMKLLNFLDTRFRHDSMDQEFSAEHPDDFTEMDMIIDADSLKLWEIVDTLDATPADKRNMKEKIREDEKVVSGTKPKYDYEGTTALSENEYYTPSTDVLTLFHDLHGVNVIKKERDLNGTHRFLAENVMTRNDCNQLMKLKLTAQSKIPLHIAKLFYDKTELARNFVEKYFNLTSHLYVDYTHFACRSTKPGSTTLRNDLSHPIHGDNCMFKDGRCDKRFPAFTWRDFSAIIYLNDDFDGGEFIFADSHEAESASLKPKCGHMVSFIGNALHGVKAVTRGTRCALALWMTLDPSHQELERLEAEKMFYSVTEIPKLFVTPKS
uniref:procollagen-proline 3-dioxygenase n=1 Tax=Romanomermis culicivorax TaxID=13658 RepID=A0A915JN90_ROMCU